MIQNITLNFPEEHEVFTYCEFVNERIELWTKTHAPLSLRSLTNYVIAIDESSSFFKYEIRYFWIPFSFFTYKVTYVNVHTFRGNF